MPKAKKDQIASEGSASTKKKAGRKPMTPAEKAAAAKARAKEKAMAYKMKPEIFVQFQDGETSIDALVEAVKDDFHKEKKRARITAMKLYVKPEEHTAYYVVNESYNGKVSF